MNNNLQVTISENDDGTLDMYGTYAWGGNGKKPIIVKDIKHESTTVGLTTDGEAIDIRIRDVPCEHSFDTIDLAINFLKSRMLNFELAYRSKLKTLKETKRKRKSK